MLETRTNPPEIREENIRTVEELRRAKPRAEDEKVVVLTPKDLPLYCPNPASPVTAKHPGVFLPIQPNSDYRCPYCGTLYRLEGEPKHHAFA